jgi:arsenate reductase-like glutaredoxin family protein
MTCGKTQGFLAKAKIDTAEQVDAKKVRLGPEQALGLLKEVDELYVAKGPKVVHLDLKKDRPERATLLGLLLGPSGNLRAPTLRKGRTLLVGFDESTYKAVLR